MNELTVFKNENFGSVRTINREGEPWFVANDVCRVLAIYNPHDALKRLDDDEKSGVDITDPHGRTQKTNVINESGLYALILTSRKPQAHEFKRWITHDVIPAIRKTGSYSVKPGITIDPDTLSTLLSTAMTETGKQILPMMAETVKQLVPVMTEGMREIAREEISKAIPPIPVMQTKPSVPAQSNSKKKRKRNRPKLKDFEQVINSVAREQKISCHEISRRLNVGNTTVWNWMKGNNQPSPENYLKFIVEFEVPVSMLKEGVF